MAGGFIFIGDYEFQEICNEDNGKNLGLPEIAVNPLIAKSFASHLKTINRDKLF
jgi:hypothetical protein